MQNSENKSYELLPDKFGFLQYFNHQLEGAAIRDYFKILCEDIVPLLSKAPELEPYCMQWSEQEKEYRKKYSRLQKKSFKDIKSAFENLTLELAKENLLNNPTLQPNISALSENLKIQAETGPSCPLIYDAHDFFRDLCAQVLGLGRRDLVVKYVEVVYIKKYRMNGQTGLPVRSKSNPDETIIYEESAISACLFATSVYELKKLDALFFAKDVNEAWVAWSYLQLAVWCWNTPSSYFKKTDIAHSIYNMSLYTLWAEMNCIKERREVNLGNYLFQKNRFKVYLDLLIGQIIKDQVITVMVSANIERTSASAKPYAIEIRLDENYLLLDVEWSKDGDADTLIIKKLTYGSYPFQFMKKALGEGPGAVISSKEINPMSGSIAKYLENTNIKGILAELFFLKSKERKNDSVTFKGARRTLEEVPEAKMIELRKKITELDSYSSPLS